MLHRTLIIIIFFAFLTIYGCSHIDPSVPDQDMNIPPCDISYDNSSHQLLGSFTAIFDIETFTALVDPNRMLDTHINVTTLIPPPVIQVNLWDPVEEVVDVDASYWTNGNALLLFFSYPNFDGGSLLHDPSMRLVELAAPIGNGGPIIPEGIVLSAIAAIALVAVIGLGITMKKR